MENELMRELTKPPTVRPHGSLSIAAGAAAEWVRGMLAREYSEGEIELLWKQAQAPTLRVGLVWKMAVQLVKEKS